MNNENDLNLEDDYKNIVESADNQNSSENNEEPIDLGTVNMDKYNPQKAKEANFHLGYHNVGVHNLPSAGLFYPEGTQISIRSAKVSEIRHFSTIDENNVLDVDEKLNAIVESCTKVTNETRLLSYRDLCEEDRFYLILSIRDLTFPEPESSLKVDHLDKKGKKHEIPVVKENFQYFKIPAELDKYYNKDSRSFQIETKSFGTISMKPPTIGVMQKITGYIKDRQQKGLPIDQSTLQIIPYMSTEWRGFDEKAIFDFEIEMEGWGNKKFNLIYTLAEKMKIGVQPNMLVNIGDLGEEVPIGFRDGIKSLFIVQDIAGELL